MIPEITSNLQKRDGIYFSKTKAAISYPEDQNKNCMQFEADSFWFRHRNDCIQAMMKNYAPSGAVLDIGAGNGFVSLAIREIGFQTILLEPGEEGIRNAQRRGLDQLICATFDDAEFKEGSLAAAGMFDVLEHIADDSDFLKGLHRKMKAHARLYLTVPAFNFLWSQVDEDAGHFRRYTQRSMLGVLEAVGFTLEYGTYIFSALPLPILLFRSIPSRLGLRKEHQEITVRKRKEHTRSDRVLTKVWKWERKKLAENSRIPFGGTLLVTAMKS